MEKKLTELDRHEEVTEKKQIEKKDVSEGRHKLP
jgi:hypothetical protein